MEEVSVLLLLSKGGLSGFEEGAMVLGGGAETCGPVVIPFINRFVKPSTFSDCRLGPGAVLSVAVRSATDMSAQNLGFSSSY